MVLCKAGGRTAAPLPGAAESPVLGKGARRHGGGVGGSVCGEGLCPPMSGMPLGSQLHSLSFLVSAGLAVHQIITITVSLIMVIAALITTLVLKNW